MVVTCSLSVTEAKDGAESNSESLQKTTSERLVVGTGTGMNGGNEADLWIDI